jgi:hypothetical protein
MKFRTAAWEQSIRYLPWGPYRALVHQAGHDLKTVWGPKRSLPGTNHAVQHHEGGRTKPWLDPARGEQ